MPLTAEQTRALRDKLQAERSRVLENAARALGFSREMDREAVGRDSIDETVAEELYSTQLRLHDREKKLLGKIDKALDRLEQGEIDVCEDCEESIGFKRLLARPVTTLCTPCKEQREAEEAMHAAPGEAQE